MVSFQFGGVSPRDRIERVINEAQTAARVDRAIAQYKAEVDALDPPAAPEILHHPVDPELQPGESALLGGAMEIRAPWADKN